MRSKHGHRGAFPGRPVVHPLLFARFYSSRTTRASVCVTVRIDTEGRTELLFDRSSAAQGQTSVATECYRFAALLVACSGLARKMNGRKSQPDTPTLDSTKLDFQRLMQASVSALRFAFVMGLGLKVSNKRYKHNGELK